jgi:hypothetical protein
MRAGYGVAIAGVAAGMTGVAPIRELLKSPIGKHQSGNE